MMYDSEPIRRLPCKASNFGVTPLTINPDNTKAIELKMNQKTEEIHPITDQQFSSRLYSDANSDQNFPFRHPVIFQEDNSSRDHLYRQYKPVIHKQSMCDEEINKNQFTADNDKEMREVYKPYLQEMREKFGQCTADKDDKMREMYEQYIQNGFQGKDFPPPLEKRESTESGYETKRSSSESSP
eukprot:TRINITY_DN5873_c0_g1_i5.p1 TRINITY_DN5873_c0_g1~~TRINITY_DN5873_c0_g1_i5.p1  ORF type:complete len:184 (+),score=35.66 TRINITY_DN5873_c0_g1_i5:306-857(+)